MLFKNFACKPKIGPTHFEKLKPEPGPTYSELIYIRRFAFFVNADSRTYTGEEHRLFETFVFDYFNHSYWG